MGNKPRIDKLLQRQRMERAIFIAGLKEAMNIAHGLAVPLADVINHDNTVEEANKRSRNFTIFDVYQAIQARVVQLEKENA